MTAPESNKPYSAMTLEQLLAALPLPALDPNHPDPLMRKVAQSTAPLPPALERDPIALDFQTRGIPVTRANWLIADRGYVDEADLDPETFGMLARMFPPEDEES